MLTMQFGDNLLKETNSYQLIIENEEDLAGLPESVRSAASVLHPDRMAVPSSKATISFFTMWVLRMNK